MGLGFGAAESDTLSTRVATTGTVEVSLFVVIV